MTNYARTAGILSIISGAFGCFAVLIMSLMAVFIAVIPTLLPASKGSNIEQARVMIIMMVIFAFIALLMALISALAIVGGVYTMKRRRWGLAVVGAIAGAIMAFPTGVAATVLVGIARREFQPGGVPEESPLPSDIEGATTKRTTDKTMIAGILTIVAGAFGIMNGFTQFWVRDLMSKGMLGLVPGQQMMFMTKYLEIMGTFGIVWGIFIGLLALLAIVGGVFILKRKLWKLSVAGAVSAAIAFWPCGIPAIFLLAYSGNEFRQPTSSDEQIAI
jgi:hypothetical protein